MSGVHVAQVIGNHGAETESAQHPRHRVDQWKAALSWSLGLFLDCGLKTKGFHWLYIIANTPRKQTRGGVSSL